MNGLSVVIPTYNRAECLERVVRQMGQFAAGLPVEFVIVDDGSTDNTPDVLGRLQSEIPSLRWRSIPNGGPGPARNLGASMARHDAVLFAGDDILPHSPNFFQAHLDVHQRFPSLSAGALGKVTWSNQPNERVNFVMSHIQGAGGEQFGYHHMTPYSWWDYRFFYTANVSVKRAVVDDWLTEGFSEEFPAYGFEDIEFAYRLLRRHEKFGVLYVPGAAGDHLHDYSVEGFLDRQLKVGMMMKVFIDLHPELEPVLLGSGSVLTAMRQPNNPAEDALLPHYTAMAEGIKSWARLIEHSQNLGSQNWHADMLAAVFRLSFDQGLLLAANEPGANQALGYRCAIDGFTARMGRAFHVEVLGNHARELHVANLTQMLGVQQSRWRGRAARIPGARRVYRALKPLLAHLF